MIFDTYVKLIKDYQQFKSLIAESNLIEIKFDEYEKDPMAFLELMYSQFNLPGFEQAKPTFRDYIQSMSGYRKNKYVISKELLEKILDRWGFSMDLWGYSLPENVEVQ
jgi:hypothetical protein